MRHSHEHLQPLKLIITVVQIHVWRPSEPEPGRAYGAANPTEHQSGRSLRAFLTGLFLVPSGLSSEVSSLPSHVSLHAHVRLGWG